MNPWVGRGGGNTGTATSFRAPLVVAVVRSRSGLFCTLSSFPGHHRQNHTMPLFDSIFDEPAW